MKIILKRNHFKSKKITLFLQMSILTKERMKMTLKIRTIMLAGAKIIVVK